jgi:hypothetical protein
MPLTDEFEEVKETAIADERGRVTIGPRAAKQKFKVSVNAKGEILLTPIVTFSVPADEAWLYRNASALGYVRKGIEDAASGRVRDLGSFSKYADLDADE